MEAGTEPCPDDADGLVSPVEELLQRNTTSRVTYLQTFALIDIGLSPCFHLVPRKRLLHCNYVRAVGHKVTSSACADTLASWQLTSEIPHRTERVLPSLSLESKNSKARTQKSGDRDSSTKWIVRSRRTPSTFQSHVPLS